jgi:hypothetical protein
MTYRNIDQLASAIGQPPAVVRSALHVLGIWPRGQGRDKVYNDADVKALKRYLNRDDRTYSAIPPSAEAR